MSAIVLGLQGTVDYEVEWDPGAWDAVSREFALTTADLDRSRSLETERDIAVAFLDHLRHGRGGESFAASSALVERFARRFRMRITLGGTCVRAAFALREFGVGSTLHLVSTDDNVRRLLPTDCDVITSATGDTLDPHLILQYPAGARVRLLDSDVVSPHANRLIVTNDPPARSLHLSPLLAERAGSADVFMMSGLNSIQEQEVLESRLDELSRILSGKPRAKVVFFEDAGYHRPEMAAHVRATLAPLVDVYSMNEDELEQRIGRSVDLVDPIDVGAALTDLAGTAACPVYVVHTKYWAVAIGDGSDVPALDSGVATASARYLRGDAMTAADIVAIGDLPHHPAGVAVVDALRVRSAGRIHGVAARSLLSDDPTTIGLGDTFVGGFVASLVDATARDGVRGVRASAPDDRTGSSVGR